MHAVVVAVTVNDGEAATAHLREQIVPSVSQAPGVVAGYWVRLESGSGGGAMIVCESENAARDIASLIEPPPDGPSRSRAWTWAKSWRTSNPVRRRRG